MGAMIDDLLESGALIQVLPHEYRTSRGYYLALTPTSIGFSAAEVFRESSSERELVCPSSEQDSLASLSPSVIKCSKFSLSPFIILSCIQNKVKN